MGIPSAFLIFSGLSLLVERANAQAGIYYACGSGTTCVAGATCVSQNPYYSQCLPATATSENLAVSETSCTVAYVTVTVNPTTAVASSGSEATSTSATVVTNVAVVSSSISTSSSVVAISSSSVSASVVSSVSSTTPTGKVSFAGINIAGCDFGCDTTGTCSGTQTCPPATAASQMTHFVNDDGLNMFRLPVGWQYLVANDLGGTLDPTFFASYDSLVQDCLTTGAHCIIDVHNYARWNNGIIGQGGPTNDQFTSLWSQLATNYANESKIVFGIMNEPHDLPDIDTWAATVQAAVSAIRATGATSQMILLPGNAYTSATSFVDNGSAAALSNVTDPSATGTSLLIYDVHQYLDSDASGTHADCVTDAISTAFTPLATYLRSSGRQALLSETGGGNTASCVTDLCSALDFLMDNSDVYLGWQGWAAGAFDTTYVLTETPTGTTDQEIVASCVAGVFNS